MTEKYVAALWADYTKYGSGFKILSEAKLYSLDGVGVRQFV